ncbi:MAG TPA: nitrate reductase molybdenum cofactor assembly chaperone [Actinoplanes sp.]
MSWRPVAARAASLLLRYPDEQVMAALPTLSEALTEVPREVGDRLRPVAEYRRGTDLTALAAEYVELFDFRRRCCLHLTYYSCGDTRKRGEALVGFTAAYKAAGLEVVGGELADYLPAVLDLAAVDDSGWGLLRDNRAALELLSAALDGSVYANVVDTVRELLPPARRSDHAAAVELARTGPPTEQVGLEPYRLAGRPAS